MDMTIKDPSDYIDNLNPQEREHFDRIEQLVRRQIPDADLVMSYGLPTFKLNGKVILHFGAFKDHMSVFPGASPVGKLADKLTDYKVAKGTIQFTPERPLPAELLSEIIELCHARAKGA